MTNGAAHMAVNIGQLPDAFEQWHEIHIRRKNVMQKAGANISPPNCSSTALVGCFLPLSGSASWTKLEAQVLGMGVDSKVGPARNSTLETLTEISPLGSHSEVHNCTFVIVQMERRTLRKFTKDDVS